MLRHVKQETLRIQSTTDYAPRSSVDDMEYLYLYLGLPGAIVPDAAAQTAPAPHHTQAVQHPPPAAPRRARRRKERVFRVRRSIDTNHEEQVIKLFRLNKAAIRELLGHIERYLLKDCVRPTNIPPMTKLLSVLHVLASGSFQSTSAVVCGVSQASISSYIHTVLDAIMRQTPRYLHFPDTPAQLRAVKHGFYQIAGFPNVIGAIDCTHVTLLPPSETERVYRNRKHTHSMNIQATVDHNGMFTSVLAKYPGSVHDAFIFRHSALRQRLLAGVYGNGTLVGDQGYALETVMMTPIKNPITDAEKRYNKAHVSTRNIVERSFGVLKARFRCLDLSGGRIVYPPETVCKFVIVSAILHNICVRNRLPVPDDYDMNVDDEMDTDDGDVDNTGEDSHAGSQLRRHLLQNVFNV